MDAPLCRVLRRLDQGPLEWNDIEPLRREVVERVRREVDPTEAAVLGSLAWFLGDFQVYQEAFDEDFVKLHGATWDQERKRLWRTLAPALLELERAACEGTAHDRIAAVGTLLPAWARETRLGRPRA